MAAIALRVTPGGTNDKIVIDGRDVSRACRGYTLRAEVGCLPELTLDLVVIRPGDIDGEAEVIVPGETATALVALGWTPPPGTL